jgi:hypothetical protein
LAAFINTLTGTGGECHAIVMRSCITAGIQAYPTFSPPREIGVTAQPPDVSLAR